MQWGLAIRCSGVLVATPLEEKFADLEEACTGSEMKGGPVLVVQLGIRVTSLIDKTLAESEVAFFGGPMKWCPAVVVRGAPVTTPIEKKLTDREVALSGGPMKWGRSIFGSDIRDMPPIEKKLADGCDMESRRTESPLHTRIEEQPTHTHVS
eukprot:Rhum_TRINITY_DN574_c0_g1::Rhum_TRINITY_DN574_c0_g1_i1::g.1809::m.1809